MQLPCSRAASSKTKDPQFFPGWRSCCVAGAGLSGVGSEPAARRVPAQCTRWPVSWLAGRGRLGLAWPGLAWPGLAWPRLRWAEPRARGAAQGCAAGGRTRLGRRRPAGPRRPARGAGDGGHAGPRGPAEPGEPVLYECGGAGPLPPRRVQALRGLHTLRALRRQGNRLFLQGVPTFQHSMPCRHMPSLVHF